MAEEITEQAKELFRTLCGALDECNLKYTVYEEYPAIECPLASESPADDHMPINVLIEIDSDSCLIRLLSSLPFSVPEDKRYDYAAAVSWINCKLVDGYFTFSIEDGSTVFCMGTSYFKSDIDKSVFLEMLVRAHDTIDNYNDRLLQLAEDKITLDSIIYAETA